jgi:signal peptidase
MTAPSSPVAPAPWQAQPTSPGRAVTVLRVARRGLFAFWVALIGALLALVALTQLAPWLGGTTFIVHGGSMEPSIHLGSLMLVTRVDPASVAVGDVVTVRTASSIVTHRVVTIDHHDGTQWFTLKGDANEQPDGAPYVATDLIGRVLLVVPVAGYVLAMLGMPTGIASWASMLLAILLSVWLLEDLEHELRTGDGEGPEGELVPAVVALGGQRPDRGGISHRRVAGAAVGPSHRSAARATALRALSPALRRRAKLR